MDSNDAPPMTSTNVQDDDQSRDAEESESPVSEHVESGDQPMVILQHIFVLGFYLAENPKVVAKFFGVLWHWKFGLLKAFFLFKDLVIFILFFFLKFFF